MRKFRLCSLTLLLFVALPGIGHAQGGWWDTLEQFSGPGPFSNGGVVEARIGCFSSGKETKAPGTNKTWTWWFENTADAKDKSPSYPCVTLDPKVISGYVAFRWMHATTLSDQPLFSDRPLELQGTVGAQLFEGLVMHQVIPAVSIGAGAGFLLFTGSTLDKPVHPVTVTPIAVSVTPFRLAGDIKPLWLSKLSRVLVLNFEEVAVLGTFRATDFNSTSTSTFKSTTELRSSYSMVFDVTHFFFGD